MNVKQTMMSLITGIGATLIFSTFVAAQQPASPGQPKSMDDMMKECRTHCQTTTATLDQLTRQMDNAKQSNDPAQMRTALDAVQKPLAEMKDHMTGCMGMMSMMEKMHGGRGGMMQEGSSGSMGGMGGHGDHMGGMMQEKKPESGGKVASERN